MDEVDLAQERMDRQMKIALASQYMQHATSAYFCVDCDERISEARRQAYPGVQRCVECQEDFEREQHRGV